MADWRQIQARIRKAKNATVGVALTVRAGVLFCFVCFRV